MGRFTTGIDDLGPALFGRPWDLRQGECGIVYAITIEHDEKVVTAHSLTIEKEG